MKIYQLTEMPILLTKLEAIVGPVHLFLHYLIFQLQPSPLGLCLLQQKAHLLSRWLLEEWFPIQFKRLLLNTKILFEDLYLHSLCQLDSTKTTSSSKSWISSWTVSFFEKTMFDVIQYGGWNVFDSYDLYIFKIKKLQMEADRWKYRI